MTIKIFRLNFGRHFKEYKKLLNKFWAELRHEGV